MMELIHGDCLEVLPTLASGSVDAVITDPPYPNNAGHFEDGIEAARIFCQTFQCSKWLVFWNELERPPVPLPLVAVHIWHRNNVNGRPYEPIYHFEELGQKRRSEVGTFPAVFNGAGPGCREYLGHPTQKSMAAMRWLLRLSKAQTVLDPFMGSGTTGIACYQLGLNFIGIESNAEYFAIAKRRIEQAQMQPMLALTG